MDQRALGALSAFYGNRKSGAQQQKRPILVTAQGVILGANRIVREALGYEEGEIRGLCFTDYILPESWDRAKHQILCNPEAPADFLVSGKGGDAWEARILPSYIWLAETKICIVEVLKWNRIP